MPILLMLPLSPVWLVENERYEDAAKSVGWLCGRRCNVEAEVEDIKKHLEEAQESQPTFRDLLRFTYLKPCFLAASIALLRQFCGYFTVICFTVSIFQSAGSSINPNIATIIVGLVVLVFTCINSFSVDKLGRRRLAITSSFSMTLMLTLLGAYFEYKDRLSNYGWLPLAALVIFVASFSMGISSLMFIIIGELVPIQIKSRVTGLILGVGWVSQFITLQTYEYMREAFHDSGTFWFYACCCAVLLLVCVFALPETKGRSLREIERDVTHSKRSADDDTQPTDIS
jgi:facilitated trehalose transporter